MGIVELFILAVGLSMDAFAVSICKGLSLGKIKPKHMCIAGAWFGGFQALMPLIGYYLGSLFADMVTRYSHWVAFALLLAIGGNMIFVFAPVISAGKICFPAAYAEPYPI